MSDETKIMLSEQELEIVKDTNWILTKQEIIRKVYRLFNNQIPAINTCLYDISSVFPEAFKYGLPRISKGENYNEYPYVMLDYPASFSKEKIFALRTMFWWGHFFSITLHLSGEYKDWYEERICSRLIQSEGSDFFVCVNEDQWQHHFEASNYRELNQLGDAGLAYVFQEKDFLKIAIKIDLANWNDIDSLLEAAYKKMIQLLSD